MTESTPIDFSLRPAWIDRWLETLEMEIDDDLTLCSEVVVFPDHSTRVPLRVDWSEDEFTRLYSCVLFGSAILFPSKSERGNVLWSLLKAVDCMPTICSEMIDCINNDTDVQNALALAAQNGGYGLLPSDNPKLNSNMVDASCDEDILFGNVTAIWTTINQTTVDFLELLSAATDVFGLFSEIVSAIPIVNQLPVDEALALVEKFADWTLEAYEAALTTPLVNQIRCDLFCIAVENCGLTMDDLLTYFGDHIQANSQVNIKNFADFVDWLLTLVTTLDDLFVYGISLFQLQVVSLAERFLNIDVINYYINSAALGDPSDDWTVICDPCADTWEYTWELTDSSGHPFNILEGTQQAGYVQSVFNSGLGLQSQQLTVDFGEEIHVTKVSVDSWMTNLRPSTSPEGSFFRGSAFPFTTSFFTFHQAAPNTIETHQWTGDIDTNGLRLRLVSGTTGSNRQYSVTIGGTGTDPFA